MSLNRLVYSGVVFALTLFCAAESFAVNSVVVESKAVSANAANAQVRIRITNDISMSEFDVPLVIRSITPGSFITTLQLSFGERMPLGFPMPTEFRWQYATPNGTCKPGGFGTISFSDGLSHPVASSPEGVLFSRYTESNFEELPPGADLLGSLILNMSINSTLGTFEIDTTCTDPSNRLYFYSNSSGVFVVPAFTKGTITIATDSDSDGIPDIIDNCPSIPNFNQLNNDGDALGDACDTLRLRAYSPVNLIVISPDGSDSIGPTFNTFGSGAEYDSTTDYGVGPNGVPGETDEEIRILEPEPGQYVVKVIPESGAGGNYFMGVRDPGGNVDGYVRVTAATASQSSKDSKDDEFIPAISARSSALSDATAVAGCPGANSQATYSPTPIANPVPPAGQFHSFAVLVAPQRRGDMDDNGVFDIIDVVSVINVAFRGSSPPSTPGIADVNSDCISSDIQDVVTIIGHTLRGLPAPGP